MKALVVFFIRRPVTVIMIMAAMIIAAVFSLFSLSVNRLPDFSIPQVTVETVYQGMAANEVRSLVTIPLEDALSPVKSLERIRSVSRDNRSLIVMDFRWGTDPLAASVLVREAIDRVYPALPEGVRKPVITTGSSNNEPHAIITVYAHNGNAAFMRSLADYDLRSRLRKIDGVGSVVLVGGEVAEERILLDMPRLAALGLSPSEFARLLAGETADVPAGNAREGNTQIVIISSGKPDSVSSLSQTILPIANGAFNITDAGRILSSPARQESVFVCNGKEVAALEIYRRPGADPLRLSRDIRKAIEEASNIYSRDAQIEIVMDSSPSLLRGIKSLVFSSALAAAAVIIVLFLFIRRLKYSLLASFSIPFAAAAGILALFLTGRSLNSMSLSGLAMGIGLVSDVSVIVLDLLHRSFSEKENVPQPPEIGKKVFSISGSSAASTLTTTLVFMPMMLLPGPLGSLFGDIAVSLASSVAAGWFYAQFCLPSIYRLFFSHKTKKSPNASGTALRHIEKKYSASLLSLIHSPAKMIAIIVLLTITGGVILLLQPFSFINPDVSEEILISAVFPSGTLTETAGKTGAQISGLISDLPSVKTVYGRAGAEEEDVSRRADMDYIKEELVFHCLLERGVKPGDALAEIYETLSLQGIFFEIPFYVYYPKDRTEVLLGLSSGREFIITGKDREELDERASIIQEILSGASIAANYKPAGLRPEIRIYPNREAAAFLSIPAALMAETLYVLNEGVVAVQLEIGGKPVDVRVTGQVPAEEDPAGWLEQIPLKTSQGKTVQLGSVARIERKEAEVSLARLDKNDVLYADIPAEGNDFLTVNKIAARFPWFARADESAFGRYKNSLFIYIALVLVLLYITMGAQFESFLLPLVIMMSIPFSLAGAGPAILLSGQRFDSGAVLGLTALFGLVVNNSLVLYEISDEKIKKNLSVIQAVHGGACERMRAILITTSTTVFALVPLAAGPLGNSQKSMAAAMLGGLAASTLLSLFAVPPVLVGFFKWKKQKEAAQ